MVDASGATVATASIPGGTLQELRLPWNALSSISLTTLEGQTQQGPIAYKLTSTVPVTVYQFNPILSKEGAEYSFTNDASLLLPAHILGDATATPASTYLAVTMPHERLRRECLGSLVGDQDAPSFVAIVATSPGTTTVEILPRGAIAAGGPFASTVPPGQRVSVTLSQFEVLQLASARYGNPVTVTRQTPSLDCFLGFYPYDDTFYEYRQSDLTGSVITSDKPIAVYAGADCRFVPFGEFACDHLEQQLPPFATWGNAYAAVRTQTPPGGNTSVGDVWRIVAAVDGTTLTFDPPSVQSNVTLGAGQWIELQTTSDFLVQSQDLDHPILVAQYMVGQDATGSTMGDPTMILAIPTAQYMNQYTFTTPTTIAQDYVNIVRPMGATIVLDGTPVGGPWFQIGTSTFEAARISIGDGTHSITGDKPFGITVYGYDEYVSYGYPGGLDLQSIVIINPGG